MNPIIWKIGIPVAIIAALAFMRWTNSKASGEPFFPGVGESEGKKGGVGSGGLPLLKTGSLTSPNDVQDSGTYSEFSDNGTTDSGVTDSSSPASDSNFAVSSTVTGAGAGTGVAGSSIPALRGGIGIGGVSQPSAPVDSSSPASDSNFAVSSTVTGAGAGTGVAGSSIPALRGGIGIGGVSQPSAPVAAAIIQNTITNPYTGGYQPYSPTPATVPVSNQFGGQGGGGVFAI